MTYHEAADVFREEAERRGVDPIIYVLETLETIKEQRKLCPEGDVCFETVSDIMDLKYPIREGISDES